MRKACVILLLCVICFPTQLRADVPEYTVKRTTEKMVIDGILDEGDWEAAESVGDFTFFWPEKVVDRDKTEVKMLWDDTFLYVSYKCDDKRIWAAIYDTNAKTFLDDCVELFWNPNPEAGKNYNMFEFNCIGNLLSVYTAREKSIRDRTIMVPHIVPLPPVKGVPPMITAAIASSSNPIPILDVLTALNRDDNIIAEMLTKTPLIV